MVTLDRVEQAEKAISPEDFVASDGWWAVDLLEPIAEKWQLFLKF